MSGRRRALRGQGLPEHPQPFPPAIRIDNLVFSSAIGGYDPVSGALPAALEDQARHAFGHLETVMALAGGTVGDIAKVVVYLTDRTHRDQINIVWTELFADEADRPVRHTVVGALPAGMLVQLEIIAVLPPSPS